VSDVQPRGPCFPCNSARPAAHLRPTGTPTSATRALTRVVFHPHTVTESQPCADVWQVGMLACLTRGWWTCPCGPHGTLLPIPILPVLVRLPFPFAICPAPPCPALLACMQGTPSGALGVASPCCCSSWQGPRSMCGALGPQAASAWTDQARLPT
jgi:hypothetical protein